MLIMVLNIQLVGKIGKENQKGEKDRERSRKRGR